MIRIGPYMTAEDFGAEHAVYDRHGGILGLVRWYPRWRRHVFDATAGALLSEDCMTALATWIRGLDQARKPPSPRPTP